VTEDIGLHLSKIADLRVISRAVVLDYQRRDKSLREMAKELDLTAALSGSVRWDGDQLRVVAQLVDPESGEQLWAQSYDRRTQDVFAVQSEIARRIAEALAAELTGGEQEQVRTPATRD